MHVLVLGGTIFIGRHLVDEALRRGHHVTMFNRGRTGGDLSHTERLYGDRDGDISALEGRHWDAVVDLSGYLARQVRATASMLGGSIGRYLFISSMAVFPRYGPGFDEDCTRHPLGSEVTERAGETYGRAKAQCEAVLEDLLGERLVTIRPGIVVGPHDPTDRIAYWAVRGRSGGEVLAPREPDRPVQVVDARDLSAFVLDLAEAGRSGPFNVVGPSAPLTMAGLLNACTRSTGSTPVWVDETFLLDQGVTYADLPFWLPPDGAAVFAADCSKATAAGLRPRSIEASVDDTLAWLDRDLVAGLTPSREAALLASWHCR